MKRCLSLILLSACLLTNPSLAVPQRREKAESIKFLIFASFGGTHDHPQAEALAITVDDKYWWLVGLNDAASQLVPGVISATISKKVQKPGTALLLYFATENARGIPS